ncbi:hypothetical protein VTO42DRAFT_1996 [Malbranchea cinnamomea]
MAVPTSKISVRSFKTLTSKIHPPLPRTKRESQQLLNILSTSFRRQLDKQHPPPEVRAAAASQPDYPVRKPGPIATPAKHLKSILDHPLFNPTDLRSTAQDVNKQQTKDRRRHPLAVLVDAIASGRADVPTLYACLKAHRSMMRSLTDLETRQVMETARVGSTIISWFVAASPEWRGLFFNDRFVMALVMPYMSSQGLQESVMAWLELLFKQDPAVAGGRSEAFFNAFYEFSAAEVRYGGGINSAMELFTRIANMQSIAGDLKENLRTWLRPTAVYLAKWISSNETQLCSSPIQAETFEKFSAHFYDLVNHRVYRALLALYHPTHPNSQLAFGVAQSRPAEKVKDQYSRNRLLRLSFKAAEVSMQQDRLADAKWFLEYARSILPKDPVPVSEFPMTSSELISRLDPTSDGSISNASQDRDNIPSEFAGPLNPAFT